MENEILEYRVVTSNSAERLNSEVEELISKGWKPIGSHQVVIIHIQNRFRGMQHIDTLNTTEYSQTLTK